MGNLGCGSRNAVMNRSAFNKKIRGLRKYLTYIPHFNFFLVSFMVPLSSLIHRESVVHTIAGYLGLFCILFLGLVSVCFQQIYPERNRFYNHIFFYFWWFLMPLGAAALVCSLGCATGDLLFYHFCQQ